MNEMPKDQILSLDIGTRSVIGIIFKKTDNKFVVVDHEYTEHQERAMLDGQIHDIDKVTEAVVEIVGRLEERNGKIGLAAIAAAGRALMTKKACEEIELDITKEIDKELTDRLQMLAIQKAQEGLLEPQTDSKSYYSVGHSVVNYKLDNALILNPQGHRGNKLTVEIIATFLPHIVVDSLYAVLKKAGLEVLNLTLEPIAAMNVAIPSNLRLLNLALVDIGAGTSDIAISKDGTIHSYGMVASAGDKLTEKIATKYLLDFSGAEKLKICASLNDNCKYTDVLGMTHEVSAEEVNAEILPDLEDLAKKIANTIIELNGKPSSALFCIGGGSQLRGLKEVLSKEMQLPHDRVAIKSASQLDRVQYAKQNLDGPEYITPIGIGVTAFEERDHDFIQVTVNEKSIRLLNTKRLQVSDALILTGFNARSLLSERGPSIFVNLDGENTEIKGNFGDPAKIMQNGELVGLDSQISHQDKITVIPATMGKSKIVRLDELVSLDEGVYFGESKVKTTDYISVNGTNRTGEYIIKDGDEIVKKGIKTVSELANNLELDLIDFAVTKDGLIVENSETLKMEGKYSFKKRSEEDRQAKLKENSEEKETQSQQMIKVVVNGNEYLVSETAVFIDLFDIIGFDTKKKMHSGVLILTVNDEKASYMQPLEDGDEVQIYWER